MNELLNIRRFIALFLKHSLEHYRIYLMSFAVLAGIFVLGGSFLFYVIPDPPDTGLQAALFAILLFITGTIFTSTVFADFGVKNQAIPALILPATSFEKYLVGWIYSYPIFLLLYTGLYYLILAGLASLKHWPSNHFVMFNAFQRDLIIIPVIYSILHSVAIYGALYFDKLQFIKTGFIFFIGYCLCTIANTFLLKALTGEEIQQALPFGYLNFYRDNHYYSFSKFDSYLGMIFLVILLATVLIWTAAYFRLKEKQI